MTTMTLTTAPRHRQAGQSHLARIVVDPNGTVLGTVVATFRSEGAAWLGVDVGRFHYQRVVMAPLEGCRMEGTTLVVPWDASVVRKAPKARPSYAELIDELSARRIRRHYGL